ncbi:HAD family hydrolase [Paenibacillus sp. GP183]|uniref:HAD family hydrolase n=1 Tax=Paenibacillus sp. GP183 TaxID=1882751 RepID=UPI00089547CC|nr:HAD family hydrolase [Paenibacillus sp. GP183]SEC42080.1 Cof subfamily of IIB subfamily of haloacid dehalogenase superfamily/HAD-superfamily hydrolase, subfamily IIB [Paenibacillus sp. GP183]
MDISAIVLDLDGTLLNSSKKVSERNLDAVLRCSHNGMKIIVATARPPRSVRALLPIELLDISSFVFYNGALIVDVKAGLEEHIPIDRTTTEDILDYCSVKLPDCVISLEVKDHWYSNHKILDNAVYNPLFHPIVCEYRELKQHLATKILITDFGEPKELRLLFEEKVNYLLTDKGKLVQMMNKSVSKATGILKLISHYGINTSQIIVFGDDYNDIEMFKISAYSVAMLNAVDELKNLADEITDTNDNDGVAQILEMILRGVR